MTRASRVSVELFMPPLLGASPFLVMALVTWTPGMIPIILLVAYVLAILPSMTFTVVMELAFWRGLDPRSAAAVLLAAGLGLLSGLAIGFIGGVRGAADKAFFFGLIGLLVGTGTALLVRWRSAAARRKPTDGLHPAGARMSSRASRPACCSLAGASACSCPRD